MNKLMIFENKRVEVLELNGQILFNPYHCGECLGLAESSVRDALRKMNNKQVIKLRNLDVDNTDIRRLNQSKLLIVVEVYYFFLHLWGNPNSLSRLFIVVEAYLTIQSLRLFISLF